MRPTRQTPPYLRAANFAILVIALVAVAAALGMLLRLLLHSVDLAQTAQKHDYLVRLAYLVGGLLILTVLVLAVVVIHYATLRMKHPGEAFKPMGHVDAWSESARRLDAKDAPPVEPFEKPPPEE